MTIVTANFNFKTVISFSPCDLIKCENGLFIKRGANFLWIKNNTKIQAIEYLYSHFSGQELYGVILRIFIQKFDGLILDELLCKLYNAHMIEIIESTVPISHKFLDSEKVFFEQLGISIPKFQEALVRQPILIIGENLICKELGLMIQKYGVGLYQNISYEQAFASHFELEIKKMSPSTAVFCSLDGKTDMLLKLNKICKQHSVKFLPILLRDAFCYIGPLAVPGLGACFECSTKRYNANHQFISRIYNNALSGVFPLSDHTAKFIAAMVFQVCINSVVERNTEDLGSIIEMNINTFSVLKKQILVTPECSVCY